MFTEEQTAEQVRRLYVAHFRLYRRVSLTSQGARREQYRAWCRGWLRELKALRAKSRRLMVAL